MNTVEMRDILFSNLRSYVNHDLDCFDNLLEGCVMGEISFAYSTDILSADEYYAIGELWFDICKDALYQRKEDFELAKKVLLDKIDCMQVPFPFN